MIDGLSISNWESGRGVQAFAGRQYHCYQCHGGNVGKILCRRWRIYRRGLRRFRERDDILQVKETEDIYAAKEQGKTGIILSFQNASPIENEVGSPGGCFSPSACA